MTPNFEQAAADALRILAEQCKVTNKCSFHDAWNHVTRQRSDLSKLANRELPSSSWAAMEQTAQNKFFDGINISPDGRRTVIDDSTPKAFAKSYDSFYRRDPSLSPKEIWDSIKVEHPNVFWPFVAMTGQIEDTSQNQSISNRVEQEREQQCDRHEVQMEVATFLRQLAEREQNEHRLTFDQAWNRVRNRERALDSLMCGRLTPEQVFIVRPDLFRRLYVDHA